MNECIFKNNNNGIFVDIGAHDGIAGSNSMFFEQSLNWTGLCIEANPNVFKKLIKNRNKNSINLNCAVFNKNDKISFTINDGYTEMLSGITETYCSKHIDRINNEQKIKNGISQNINVNCYTLNYLLEQNNINIVDYLSIDTEGSEKDIITNIDFNKFHINVINFEVNYRDEAYNITTNYLITNNFTLYKKIEGDDVYINNNLKFSWDNKNKIRIKMLCNWCSSSTLIKEWSNMFNNETGWNNIEIVDIDVNIDYYIIINRPFHDNDHFIPEKTIVFQMEPWVYDSNKNWGVKTWGKWAVPDETAFMKVFTHKNHLNNVQWQIDIPTIYPENRKNQVISILSSKLFDDGHIQRVHFIKYTEEHKGDLSIYIIDIFGKENYHAFKNYQSALKEDKKENHYIDYKYCFSVENNFETNYATEKIWEPILCECLTFYWGCPNLEEYIDSKAFVRLDLNDFEGSMKIVEQAISEDLWSQRIDIIRKEKQKILHEYGFFPRLATII